MHVQADTCPHQPPPENKGGHFPNLGADVLAKERLFRDLRPHPSPALGVCGWYSQGSDRLESWLVWSEGLESWGKVFPVPRLPRRDFFFNPNHL